MERETTSCILHICRGLSRRAWYCGGAGQRDWKGIVWQVPSLPRRRARAKNKLGPELNGLVGRRTGAAGGYQYSPAVKNAGFVWDGTSFAAFIANPRGKIPGNKMVFAGIKNETEIANLWTYLSHFNVDGSSK